MSNMRQDSHGLSTSGLRNNGRLSSNCLDSSVSPRHTAVDSPVRSSAFQDFQQSVDDAWDAGDDEFCTISSQTVKSVKISSSLASKTAINVIKSHISSRPSIGAIHVHSSDSRLSDGATQAGEDETKDSIAARRGNLAGAAGVDRSSCVDKSSDQFIDSSSADRLSTGSALRHPPVRYLKQKAHTGLGQEAIRLNRMREAFNSDVLTLEQLRRLCWGGIPQPVRGLAWRLLSGYLPLTLERRQDTLKRRRQEYWNFVKQYYDTRHEALNQDTYRQIHIDIPRMSPLIPLFQQRCVQEMFERILYIWAIRHPASGYVQGMNDLVTPYFIVFLQEALPVDADIDSYELLSLDEERRSIIEADSFWTMSRLLDSIQDNYTFAQPGIQTKVAQLDELVQRIDAPLHAHIGSHGIDFLQFAFRWMNNLLMRELPLHCTIRLWDTNLSEEDGFASFHLYVCAAFLTYWSKHLMAEKDFQGLMLTLQNLPTHNWTDSEVSLLVAEAYRLKFTFADAPSHLTTRSK